MHVFARPDLAELQTVRRSDGLTVVGALWLGELLHMALVKGHGQSGTGLQNIKPTPTPTHTDTHKMDG